MAGISASFIVKLVIFNWGIIIADNCEKEGIINILSADDLVDGRLQSLWNHMYCSCSSLLAAIFKLKPSKTEPAVWKRFEIALMTFSYPEKPSEFPSRTKTGWNSFKMFQICLRIYEFVYCVDNVDPIDGKRFCEYMLLLIILARSITSELILLFLLTSPSTLFELITNFIVFANAATSNQFLKKDVQLIH